MSITTLNKCFYCNSVNTIQMICPKVCLTCIGKIKGGRTLVFSHSASQSMGIRLENINYMSRIIKKNLTTEPIETKLSLNLLALNLKFNVELYSQATDADKYQFNPEFNHILLPSGFIKTLSFNQIIAGIGTALSDILDYHKIKDIDPEFYYYKNVFPKSSEIHNYSNKITKLFLMDYIKKLASINKKLESPTLTYSIADYTFDPDIWDVRDDFTTFNSYAKIMQGIRLMFDSMCYHNFGYVPYCTKKHHYWSRFETSSFGLKIFTTTDLKFYPQFYIMNNTYIKDLIKNNMFMIKLCIEYLNSIILLCQRINYYPESIQSIIKIIACVDHDVEKCNDLKYLVMMFIIMENFHRLIDTLHSIYIYNYYTKKIPNFQYPNYFQNFIEIIRKYYSSYSNDIYIEWISNAFNPSINIGLIFRKITFTSNPIAMIEIMLSSFHKLFYTYTDSSDLIYSDPYSKIDRPFSYYEGYNFAYMTRNLKDRHRTPDSCSIM